MSVYRQRAAAILKRLDAKEGEERAEWLAKVLERMDVQDAKALMGVETSEAAGGKR